MLWDVPILFVALFDQSLDDSSALECLFALPLAKFFELGTDQLLTGFFQGVGVPWCLVHRGNESVMIPGQGRSPVCRPQEKFSSR